jgi:hypothetical protein
MRTVTAAHQRPTQTYVLDTCVLLADPHALYRFDEHDLVVPLVVIEELDRKKTALDDVGRNARMALRGIEQLREASDGGLREPFPLAAGGTIRIESNHVDVPLPAYLDPTKADHRILAVAIGLRATLVTKDAGLRIKGSQLGVAVEDYRGDTVPVEEYTTGILEVDVDPSVLDDLHRDGKVQLDAEVADLTVVPGGTLWANACLVLRSGRSSSGLGRVIDLGDDGRASVHRVQGHVGGQVTGAVRHRWHLPAVPEAGQRAQRGPVAGQVPIVDSQRQAMLHGTDRLSPRLVARAADLGPGAGNGQRPPSRQPLRVRASDRLAEGLRTGGRIHQHLPGRPGIVHLGHIQRYVVQPLGRQQQPGHPLRQRGRPGTRCQLHCGGVQPVRQRGWGSRGQGCQQFTPARSHVHHVQPVRPAQRLVHVCQQPHLGLCEQW